MVLAVRALQSIRISLIVIHVFEDDLIQFVTKFVVLDIYTNLFEIFLRQVFDWDACVSLTLEAGGTSNR
jgi:hypothetical protein